MQRNAPGWRLDKSTGRSLVGRTPHCIATVTYDPERRHSAPDLRPCNWIGQRKLGRFQDCKQPVLWHRSLRRSDPQRQDCMRIAQRRTGTFPHRTESGCSNPDSPRTILHSLVGSHLPHLRQNLDCRYLRHRGSDWFALCRSRRSPDPHHRMHPGRRRVGTYPRRIAVERLHPSLRHRTRIRRITGGGVARALVGTGCALGLGRRSGDGRVVAGRGGCAGRSPCVRLVGSGWTWCLAGGTTRIDIVSCLSVIAGGLSSGRLIGSEQARAL